MKFSTKLAVFVLAIVTVTGVSVTTFVYTANRKMLEKEIIENLENLAVGIMDKIDRNLYGRYSDIKMMATDSIISSRSSTAKQITQRLVQYRNTYKTYGSLSFFDLDRIRIADTNGMGIGRQHKPTQYLEEALQGAISAASDIHTSTVSGITNINFSSPVRDENGKIFGVVVARVPISKLYEITKGLALGREEYGKKILKIDLIDGTGRLLYSSYNKKGILKDNLFNLEVVKKIKTEAYGAVSSSMGWDPIIGEKDLFIYANEQGYLNFKGNGWALLMRVPARDAFAPAVKLRNQLASIGLFVTFIAGFITFFGSRMFTRPIRKLQAVAKEIGEGNLDADISVSGKDEIGGLAASFSSMTENLKKTMVSKEYTDSIIAAILDCLVVIDADMKIKKVNKAACDLLGYTEKELVGSSSSLLFPEEEKFHKKGELEKLIKGGLVVNYETKYMTKEGSKVPVLLSGAILSKAGCSEERSDESRQKFETNGRRCDKLEGFVCMAKDITERKKAEEKFKILFMSSRDAIMTLASPTWKFVSANPATLKLFEAKFETDLLYRDLGDVSPEYQPDGASSAQRAREHLRTAMEKGSHFFEWTHKSLKGKEFVAAILLTRCEIGGQKLLQATVRDITKNKKFESDLIKKSKELETKNRNFVRSEIALKNMMQDMKETNDTLRNTQGQLIQAEKMASIGQFSAGVAHEINNPLGYIINNLEVLKKYVNKVFRVVDAYDGLRSALLHKDMERAIKAGEQVLIDEKEVNVEYIRNDSNDLISETLDGAKRIEAIVSDLKTFSRIGGKEKKLSNINEMLKRVIHLVWNEIKYNAELKEEYGQMPEIMCDEQHLYQVFANLLVNASHALKDRNGIISIRTYYKDKCAYIEIADNGEGIPENIIGKIFDPFFTTKETGVGTGLGLSISHGIIERHGGKIEVHSTVGKGTRFLVSLPGDVA